MERVLSLGVRLRLLGKILRERHRCSTDIPRIAIPKTHIPKITIPKTDIPKIHIPKTDIPKLFTP